MDKTITGMYIIFSITLFSLLGIMFIDPISQDPAYHAFSDGDMFWGIPNALNVLSNLPFLLVGVWGVIKLHSFGSDNIIKENKSAYLILFVSVAMVAFGSGYYHLSPDNTTLVWDRLPMTLAFMSLFSIIITEFVSVKWGKLLLFPLLILGLASVLYWHVTELQSRGDLRWYGLVQFYPMLVIPVILYLFPPAFTKVSAYWWLIAMYFLAKVFEHYDGVIHSILNIVSGHSIKHVFPAIGIYILINAYEKRQKYE